MYSLLQNDRTMGLANSRVVVLRGSTTASQLFSPNFFPVDSWLRTALENNGFSVIAVRSSMANWFGYAMNIEVELNVFNNHTSDEARINAIRAIEAYRANYGINKVFSNTTLSVAFDGYVSPGGQSRPSNPQPTIIPTPPSVHDQTPMPAQGGFWDNLGLGMGVSTPVVLLGAVALGLLILRK